MKYFALVAALFAVAACGRVPNSNDMEAQRTLLATLPPNCVIENITYDGGTNVMPTRTMQFEGYCVSSVPNRATQ